MKALLKKVPMLEPAGHRLMAQLRSIRGQLSDGAVHKRLAAVGLPRAEQFSAALAQLAQRLPVEDQTRVDGVEAQRALLLGRQGPLIDGSLPEPGLYDKGVSIQGACKVSKPPKPGLMLYLLVRATRPQCVLELGTNVGISASFIAAALKQNGQGGRLVTMESSPYRIKLARDIHTNQGLDNIDYVQGLFTETLTDTLAALPPVDLAFIDGHHLYQPTLDYFGQIHGASSDDAVFVFDDIRWSDGMARAWAALQADPRMGVMVDMRSVGFGARPAANQTTRHVLPPIYNAFHG